MRMLWEPLPEEGFEFTTDRLENDIQLRCTHCPQREFAVHIGGSTPDWLYHMICATDPHVVGPFDPSIRFRRTKTLMQGDDCCDHAYFVD